MGFGEALAPPSGEKEVVQFMLPATRRLQLLFPQAALL